MTVYNDPPEYLGTAIHSVLAQTFERFEFLILDDGSTRDDTIQTLDRFAYGESRIRLFREPHRGLTRTLNVGLAHCRAELVCRQDADDWSTPDRFVRQIEYLKAHPELAVVEGCLSFVPGGRPRAVDRAAPAATIGSFPSVPDSKSILSWRNLLPHRRCAAGRRIPRIPPLQPGLRLSLAAMRTFWWRNLAEPLYFHRRCMNSISDACPRSKCARVRDQVPGPATCPREN